MSQENVDRLRRGYEHLIATGDFLDENFHADFVWDMSTFHGWPEQQTYLGIEGAKQFIADWSSAWDDWELEVEEFIDAGDRVVAIVRQRGRSKADRGFARDALRSGVDDAGRTGYPDADVREPGRSPRSRRALGVARIQPGRIS